MSKLLEITEKIFSPILNFLYADHIKIKPFVIIVLIVLISGYIGLLKRECIQLQKSLNLIEMSATDRNKPYNEIIEDVNNIIKTHYQNLSDISEERSGY